MTDWGGVPSKVGSVLVLFVRSGSSVREVTVTVFNRSEEALSET